MSIQDVTGSITHNVDDIYTKVTEATNKVTTTTGTETTRSFGADFAGMNQRNLQIFKSAIDTYRDEVQAIIDKLSNQVDPIAKAFKGQQLIQAVHDFFGDIKNLLNAYVGTIDQEKLLVDEANENWQTAQTQIASNVNSDAGDIREAASSIKLS